MSDRGTLSELLQPEERLENLRFFVQEGGHDCLPRTLFDWMQEVERQVVILRKRLNELPNEYARKGPLW